MNLKKIIFIISLFALLLPGTTMAQSTGDLVTINEEVEGDPNNPPEDSVIYLFINSLELEKRYYQKDEVVRGSFKVVNNSQNKDYQNLYYEVSLVGEYEGQLPSIFYDSQKKMDQEININPGQTIDIDFNYKLPGNIGGDGLGIWVEIFSEDGYSKGWVEKRISVEGESELGVEIQDFRLIIDEIPYRAIEGPTVTPDRQGIFSVLYASEVEKEFNVELSIRKLEEQEAIFEETYTNIKSNSEGIRFEKDLLTFDYAGGVYIGTIVTKDLEGNKIAPNIEFQYIVLGDDAMNISDAFLENNNYSEGSLSGTLVVEISEPTYDLVTGDLNGDSSGILIINYKDINGEVIKTDSSNVDSINERLYTFNYLLEGVEEATAEVRLYDSEGNIIFDQKNISIKKPDEIRGVSIVTIMILIALILIFVGYMIYKIKQNKNNTGPVLAVLLVIAFSFFLTDNSAQAAFGYWSDNNCRNESGTFLVGGSRCRAPSNGAVNFTWAVPMSLTFNEARNARGETTFKAGDEIIISGSTYVNACRNGVPGMYYFGRKSWVVDADGYATDLTFEKFFEQEYGRTYNSGVNYSGGENSYDDWGIDGRGHWFKRGYHFSFSAGTAPNLPPNTTEKTFYIDVLVRNCVYAGGSTSGGEVVLNGSYHTACGHKTIQVPIVVKKEIATLDVCPNIPEDQVVPPAGYEQVFLPDGSVECHIKDEFIVSCQIKGGPRFGTNPVKVPARKNIDFVGMVEVDEDNDLVRAMGDSYVMNAWWDGVVNSATTTGGDVVDFLLTYSTLDSDIGSKISATLSAQANTSSDLLFESCSVDVVECLIDADCVYDPNKRICNTVANVCIADSDPELSCYADPEKVDVSGGNVTAEWVASITNGGGVPPYTFRWGGFLGGQENVTSSLSDRITHTFGPADISGEKDVRVLVTDNAGNRSRSLSCPVYVTPCNPACGAGSTCDLDTGSCVNDEPIITASVAPKIVNEGEQCTIFVAAEKAEHCYIYSYDPRSFLDFSAKYPDHTEIGDIVRTITGEAGNSDVVLGEYLASPGQYVVACRDTGLTDSDNPDAIYHHLYPEPLVCTVNPDVKEF